MNCHSTTAGSIVIVSEHFYPSNAATAQLISDLAQDLSEHGVNVTVISSSHGPKNYGLVNIVRSKQVKHTSFITKSKAAKGAIFLLRALWWCILDSKTGSSRHLLIVSNPPFIGILGVLTKLLLRYEYTFLLQDLFPRSAVIAGIIPANGPLNELLRCAMRLTLKYSNSTIVLSDAMKSRAYLEFGRDIPIKVIHNWAVERADHTDVGARRSLTTLNVKDSFIVQYSGNFGRLHDLLTLLDAAYILKGTNIHFQFIGGGAKLNQIQSYKSKLSIPNISIHPYQPRENLSKSLAIADICAVCIDTMAADTVAPSKLYGILASAKPVLLICPNNTQLTNLVRSHYCGIVCNSGDSVDLAELLLNLSQSTKDLEIMGQNSLKLYENKFSRQQATQSYLDTLFYT